MRKFILLISTLSMLLLSSCFSYMDMNRVYFATISLSDIEKDGTIIFYEEYFASDRGDSEQGGLVTRIVLKQEGKTSTEVFSNLRGSATFPISYDVKRAYGFTVDMAIKGIEGPIDLLERDQRQTNKMFLYVCEADPEELFKLNMEDEKFLGIWLEDLFIFQENEQNILSIRANHFLNERLKGSKVSVLPLIDIEKQPTENRLKITGAAVMKEDKMVARLEIEDIPMYKTLFNRDENLFGSFSTQYPPTGAIITLVPLKIELKENIEAINDELTLVYDLKMICSINSIIGELNLLDSSVRDGVIKAAEETLKAKGENLYKRFQKEDIDILDVELKLKRKYGDNKSIDENTFKNVKIKINATVVLDGGQNISDTIE